MYLTTMAQQQIVSESALDGKGLWSYLLITFGITYLIEGILIWKGFRVTGIPPIMGQFIIAGVMWVPAVATVITAKRVTREGLGISRIRLGSVKPYLEGALIIPLCFALVYGLTWLLGLAQPDWQLASLRHTLSEAGAASDLPITPPLFILLLFVSTITVTPFMNSILGFGEELGWRGYLLPKLMPLGKAKAYTLLGIIWGLWHAPLVAVGFNYPGYPLLGILFMCALTTALGIYINEMTLHYQSSVLAGWIHGVINAQGYGIWRILFPDANPLLGGFTGIFAIAVFAGLGLWRARRFKAAQCSVSSARASRVRSAHSE
jgi:hypothetical protein